MAKSNKNSEVGVASPVQQALGQLATVEQSIQTLIAETKTLAIQDFNDKAGHDAVHAGLMRLVDYRVTVEKEAKGIRQPLIEAQKKVIEEEKRLIGLLVPEEMRLRTARDAFRAEQERLKKEQEETARKRVTEMASKLLTMGFAFNGDTYSITHEDEVLDITDIRLRLMDDQDFELFTAKAKDITEAIAFAKAEEERLAREAAANAERVRIAQEQKAAELAAKEADIKRKEEAIAAREAEEKRKAEIKAAEERAAAEAKAEAEAAAQAAIAKAKEEAEKAKQDKRKAELQPYIVFIRDYNGLLAKEDDAYLTELADIKKGAEMQWEYDRKQMAEKAAAEARKDAEDAAKAEIDRVNREADERIAHANQAAEKAKQSIEDAFEAAERAKIEEQAAFEAEANRLAQEQALLSNKQRILEWVESLSVNAIDTTEMKINEQVVCTDIINRFGGFKDWAKKLAEKL
jgi:hypothetical protein